MSKASTSEKILMVMATVAIAGVFIKVMLDTLKEKREKQVSQKSNFVYTGADDSRHAEILGEMSELNAKIKGIIRTAEKKDELTGKLDTLSAELAQYE